MHSHSGRNPSQDGLVSPDSLARRRAHLAALREQLADARVRHLEVGVFAFRPLAMAMGVALIVTLGVRGFGAESVAWVLGGGSFGAFLVWAGLAVLVVRFRRLGIEAEVAELERDIEVARADLDRSTVVQSPMAADAPRWPHRSTDFRAALH